MSETWQRGHWMQTFTGRAFYPLDPRLEDIDPVDIGHSLGMQCRYNGHVKRFYSVAEHCVLMSDYFLELSALPSNGLTPEAGRELALWALLHDAAEAYIGDMVRPLKLHMPDFCRVDDLMTTVIAARFGLRGVSIPREVKAVDTRILLDERAALLGTPPGDWALNGLQPLGVEIRAWGPTEATVEYLGRLAALTDVKRPVDVFPSVNEKLATLGAPWEQVRAALEGER